MPTPNENATALAAEGFRSGVAGGKSKREAQAAASLKTGEEMSVAPEDLRALTRGPFRAPCRRPVPLKPMAARVVSQDAGGKIKESVDQSEDAAHRESENAEGDGDHPNNREQDDREQGERPADGDQKQKHHEKHQDFHTLIQYNTAPASPVAGK